MPDRSVVYRLRADVTQFRAQMASAAASVTTAADKMTAADRSGAKFRAGLSTLGSTAGKVGLVAAVGLGAAIIKAANFDQAMSRVAAATHESASNMELLRAAALKAGAQTVFSATESADAITAMSKAGVSAKDILAGGLNGALALASAGELDVASAADIAATAMNQFGLGGKDVGHIADLLAAGAGKAQGEVTDFAEALKFVGPVAHQMGISIEETTGTIAELATQGILGEQAGTGLRGMLLSLSSPSSLAAKEMKKLGINVYDAQGQFVGFNGVAAQLHQSMSGLTAAERDQAFGRIFGNAQVTTARILYAGGATAVDKWTNSVNDSGYAAETAKTKLNNLKGDLEQLGGSLETALIGTGDSSQGPLRSLVQGLTDVVNAYNKLPGAAKSGVGAILGGVAAVGGSIFVFSKVVQGVAATRLAMDQLGISTSRVGGLSAITGTRLGAIATKAAGVAAVGIAMGALADNVGRIDTSKLDRSLEALRKGQSTDTIKDLVHDMQSLSSWTNKIDLGEVVTLFGVFGDTTLDKQANNLSEVDQALASMVESGNIKEAQQSFDALSAAAEKQGVSLSDISDRFPEYDTALNNAGVATNVLQGVIMSATGAIGEVAAASNGATNATSVNTAAVRQNAAALKASRAAASGVAHQFVGLGASLSDSKVSLKGWIRELAAQADALTHFGNNAEKAAKKGLRQGLIKALEAAGPAGAMRMKQLANATDAEIAKANRAWAKGQAAIRKYIATVGGVPNSKATKLELLGAASVKAAAAAVTRAVNNIPFLHVVTIEQRRKFTGNNGPGSAGAITNADGGYISGPGGPREDRIPAMLSNGEFVVNAAATARNLSLLHSINAQKFATGGRVGFANGGEARSDDGHTTLRDRIRKLTAAIDLATKSLDKERTARDALISKRNDLATNVSGSFTSDLFGQQPANLSWMNAAQKQAALTQGVFSTLKSDISNANTFKSTLASLKKRGLDGDALASLASSGDVGRAQAFANLSNADLAQYKTLFAQRASAASGVGAFAGNAAFGVQITAQTNAMLSVQAEMKGLRKDLAVANKKAKAIHVHDKSGNPKKTARETARRLAMAG